MTMKNGKLRFAAVAAATILALGGIAAIAQPMGAHGPGHGPGGGMEVEHVLLMVKGKLNLNTSQQLMWDNAVAQTKAAHVAGRANLTKLHDAATAALANPAPDLAALAAVADGVHADNQTLRKGVRDQWLQIYATFSPDQKAVVRDALAKQLARMEAMGAKMREHMQQRGS
jgi:Spy/CpxP family protein refolding chaperone